MSEAAPSNPNLRYIGPISTEIVGPLDDPRLYKADSDSLARSRAAALNRATDYVKQVWTHFSFAYDDFWDKPAVERLIFYLEHEPVQPWLTQLAAISKEASDEAKKMAQDYAVQIKRRDLIG